MQVYSIITVVVVLLSTVSLFILFQQKNLKDIRYQVGLIASAVISLIMGLVFPGLVSTISADLALQLFVSFFLSLLLYIFTLFLVLMLVSLIIPKEKADKILREWEEKKQKIKNAIELKKKEKEAAALQKATNPEQSTIPDTQSEQPADIETAASAILEKEVPAHESLNTNIKAGEPVAVLEAEVPAQEPVIEEAPAAEVTVTSAVMQNEIPDQAPSNTGISAEPAIENFGTADEPQPAPLAAKEELFGDVNPEPMKMDETDAGAESIHPTGDIIPGDGADLFDNAAILLENSLENIENDEKNVDTSNIIDKMGIDMIPDRADPVSAQGQSLTEIIDKAFQLKQQGKEIEAAALYMIALEKRPDNETTFWLVLDICAIYKATGHADLAEDILLTYIDTFEDIMSEEVKDQILLSLYNN